MGKYALTKPESWPTRPNSICIDFKRCKVRPAATEIETLLKERMHLNVNDVSEIQFNKASNCVYIMFKREKDAIAFASVNNGMHSIDHDNVEYKIPVYMVDNAIEVRVHDLPPQTSDGYVRKSMSQYGEVLSIEREVWRNFFPGIRNGVRVVRMQLRKAIPSYIICDQDGIHPCKTLITYENQLVTCQFCEQPAHYGKPCTETAKRTSSNKNKDNRPTTETSERSTPVVPSNPPAINAQQGASTATNNQPKNANYKENEEKTETNNDTTDAGMENETSDEQSAPHSSQDKNGSSSPPRKRVPTRSNDKKLFYLIKKWLIRPRKACTQIGLNKKIL
ncbi:uncharacterized protein LOC131432849 [Malaya genurostris]|uniref:uncharacterized protein LOC131432849 n=1 Tax=Malaya genurostris TaxID=325434 RepID=UPI0026F3CFE4|nr:uncharacterized protein LOC131432849 [Malaya genurostris]